MAGHLTSRREEDVKSHSSILLTLAEDIFTDVYARCAANESASRDLITLRSRFEHEGLSFLTITLPILGQDFERSLDLEFVDSKYFSSFKKYRRIPAFMRGIFSQVFNADTGRILNEPSIFAIEGVRQIAYLFKKLKLPCTQKRVNKTFEGYIQDEHDLEHALHHDDTSLFQEVSFILWSRLSLVPNLDPLATVPKHGPGATAEKLSGNQKYLLSRWHDRLEPYFPVLSTLFHNWSVVDSQEFKRVTIISEADEQPVRVITVPKTLKSPRIIAIEPTCMQYTQQALSQSLVKTLERFWISRGHVNFTDQGINQNLAMVSSQTRHLATIDLSSASDRVPQSLVYDMFACIPDFRDALFACRSKSALLPKGEVIHLRKFASMGSALCFPVESMYFYTLCVAALLKIRNLPLTSKNAYRVSREVYVYGDDLVIPVNEAAAVVNFLQKYYCRVNMSKSFWTGRFRESCGMDAYDGKKVTPIYLRMVNPDNRRATSELISWVKSARLFYQSGYFHIAERMFQYVERYLGKLPVVADTSAGLGRCSFGKSYSFGRMNKSIQAVEIMAWVPKPVYRTDKLAGYSALMKCLLNLERRSFSKSVQTEKDHLLRTARYGAVALKRRWVQPL